MNISNDLKNIIHIDDDVVVLTGKYKNKKGIFTGWTEPHPLSSQRRATIRLQTGSGWITLLINENNFNKYQRG